MLVSLEHDELFHYTNAAGLKGIIESQSLWATHARFLNDDSEIVGFGPWLVTYLEPIVLEVYREAQEKYEVRTDYVERSGGLENVVRCDTQEIVEAMYRAGAYEYYICSFCGHDDEKLKEHGMLNQWQGYGKDGGFAIVFDTKGIETLLETEGARFEYKIGHLGTVVYSDNTEEYERELGASLEAIGDATRRYFRYQNGLESGLNEEDARKSLEETYEPFVYCITQWKHWGFSSENEIRAVFVPQAFDDVFRCLVASSGRELKHEKEVKWGDGARPYVEAFECEDMALPIKRIIVGPHKDKEQRADALRILLRGTGIEVTVSEIPFIG